MTRSTEKEPFPPRWAFFVAALMIIAGIGWNIYMQYSATQDKNTAQANSQTLAQDIQTICKAQGKLLIEDRDLCAKADKVQDNPTEAIPGAKGDRGNDGATGRTGATGAKGDKGDTGATGAKGDKGDKGDEGVDATGAPGAAGGQGLTGATGAKGDKGDPGADGAPGTPGADGAPGTPGTDGTDGRGLADAQCGADGRWAMYWTDGTTTDGGVCREDPAPPIGVLP